MSIKRFDDLLKEVMASQEGRAAYNEQSYAIRLANQLDARRIERGWSLRRLAEEMGTSLSQVQRVLAMHGSGTIKLRTIFMALDALDLELAPPELRPKPVSTWSSATKIADVTYTLGENNRARLPLSGSAPKRRCGHNADVSHRSAA